MAACYRCQKEFSDEFAFCPFCGAKKILKRRSALTNFQVLTAPGEIGDMGKSEFGKQFRHIPAEERNAILNWLCDKHDAIDVYALARFKDPKRWKGKSTVYIRESEAAAWELAPEFLCIREKMLTAEDIRANYDGIYFTKEEAETALQKYLVAEHKEGT